MKFDYLQRIVVESQLDVENIGECTILGRNDFGEEFYLIIRTELGWTEVFEYGPIVPDFKLLPPNITMKYNRFEFSEYRIEKLIDKFLNDGKRGISQAEVTSVENIYKCIINPLDKMFPLLNEELKDE